MKQNNLKIDNSVVGQDPSQASSVFGTSNFSNPPSSQFGGEGGDFGGGGFTSTDAVSQILNPEKDSASTTKKLILGGGVALGLAMVFGVLAYYWQSEDSAIETPPSTIAAISTPAAKAAVPEAEIAAPGTETSDETEDVTEDADTEPVVQGNSDSYTYNEAEGGPVIHAKDGVKLEVSRVENFAYLYVTGTAKNGNFRITNPPPGDIYWREEGASSVNKITINPPSTLNITFTPPANVSAGTELKWNSDGKVAYYKIELSPSSNFENISYIFSTSHDMYAIKDVSPGKYFTRIAGFNMASGSWNYSKASSIEVK